MKIKYIPFILAGLFIIYMSVYMYPLVFDDLTAFLLMLALVCGLVTLGSGISDGGGDAIKIIIP